MNDLEILNERYTALRRFIDSLGLDHTKLTNKQIRKWADSKQYKMFLAQYKIKKMIDHVNISDDIFSCYSFSLLNEFCYDDIYSNIITEKEVLSVLPLLERYTKIFRGKYKTLEKRQQLFKDKLLNTLYSGGKISGEGEIMFKGLGKMAKHYRLALGKDKIMLMKRRQKKSGETFYHRVTLNQIKTPKRKKFYGEKNRPSKSPKTIGKI